MINVDADHSVKFEAWGDSSPVCVVELLPFSVQAPRESLKFWGQNSEVKT